MNKAISLLIILLLSLNHSPSAAQGQIYYVDKGGSDTTGDGSLLKPWASIIYAATQVQAGDTVLINPGTYQGGIYVDSSGTPSAPITFRANGPSVIIEKSGGVRDAFYIENADYIVVEGLTIQHATRAGMRLSYANHMTIRNCTFANNGTWGLFTDFSDYTLVEDSESYGAVEQHGIYISNSSDYPTIRRNRLHHNNACGLHMNGDISMGGDGIISYGLVEGNIIYENGAGGGSGINMDGVTHTMVRNNLLYNNHASGISLYKIDGGSGSHDNQVYNNTILVASDGRWAINIPGAEDTNNQLYNNILYNAHSWHGSISIASPTLPGFASDFNVVMNRLSSDDGDSSMSLTAWQALGYDAHSIIATPAQLFVNPAAADYHLKAGSPAVDHGVTLTQVTQDLEGNQRPAGAAFDIGAYELSPWLILLGAGRDRSIELNWSISSPLTPGSDWQIIYLGPTGDQASPIMHITAPTRSYTLTGLTNQVWYTITLNAMQADTPIMTDTIRLMPSSHTIYLPGVVKAP
jgi:hypothetical protein